MRNKYFLLRHGETIYQTKKKDFLYPWPSVKLVSLTKKGKEQVKSVVEKLKAKNVNLIYSSDFLRTRQTAEIVAEKLGLKVKLDKRLRDINFGIFQGGKTNEYRKFFINKKQKFFKRPPRGESWRDVRKRTIDFIKDIEKKHKNKTILIVSHADPLWLLFGTLKGLDEDRLFKNRNNKNFYPEVGQFLLTKIK